MTTLEVEIALMQYFDITKNLIVPNVTDISRLVRFETDLLVLSKSNYATGIEIKVSKSDLKNDIKKKQWINPTGINRWTKKSNYETYFNKFKRFYYAVPIKLKDDVIDQIPDWCGIITLEKNSRNNRVYVTEFRKPTNIFNNKWTDAESYKLARLGTLRILKYKKKELNCKNKLQEVKK